MRWPAGKRQAPGRGWEAVKIEMGGGGLMSGWLRAHYPLLSVHDVPRPGTDWWGRAVELGAQGGCRIMTYECRIMRDAGTAKAYQRNHSTAPPCRALTR